MPFVDRSRVLERFRTDGSNSSHFVWLLAELKYYECENEWIFAFKQVGDVTLIALEPLVPGAAGLRSARGGRVRRGLERVRAQGPREVASFVSVYEPFAKLLRDSGFTCVKVGQEPWVSLPDCIPTGNAGKGVRNARNQALSAGLTVEEWTSEEIERDGEKKRILREIHHEWRSTRFIELSGFMNAVEPFKYASERRYFVLRAPSGSIEAYLIATPVPGRGGYFLEDLIARSNAPRGTGELLTLEAMVRLGESGGKEASLGVVSLTTIDPKSAPKLPPLIHFLMIQAPAAMSTVYNFSGMEIYRKRFKPRVWEAIHLGVRGEKGSATTAEWLRLIFALVVAFRPRPQLTWGWLKEAILGPLRRTPITAIFAVVSITLFTRINHFGNLPDWALAKFGFFANANLTEWVTRTVVSDFLYFDPQHFFTCAIPLIGLVYWGERTHKRRFFVTLIICTILFDDVINYWVLVRPFAIFRPDMFRHLIHYKDVGGSLILATLVGMQLCQFRLIREPLVALITLAFVLGFAFTSEKLEWLIMNLNHAIFFVVGFLLGKAEFEYKRYLNRRASRRRPPVARAVRQTAKPASPATPITAKRPAD